MAFDLYQRLGLKRGANEAYANLRRGATSSAVDSSATVAAAVAKYEANGRCDVLRGRRERYA